MKKALLLSCVLLALTASMALAGGLNLNWGQTAADQSCWTESPAGGVVNKTWTCTSNSASNAAVMTGSVMPNKDLAEFFGFEIVLDAQTAAAVPAWWQGFNVGACRQTGFNVSGDFTGAQQDPPVCVDPFGGQQQGGFGAWQTALFPPPAPGNVPAANRFRVKIAYVVTVPAPVSMATEYYAFRLGINKNLTTGTGSCAGCLTPVTFVLNQIIVSGFDKNDTVTNALGNQCLTTFGGAGASVCSETPARNTTWGQVKGLYR